MRKKDYAILADIIKRQREAIHHVSHYSQESRELMKDRMTMLANCFARESSVDRVEFLKACGIE